MRFYKVKCEVIEDIRENEEFEEENFIELESPKDRAKTFAENTESFNQEYDDRFFFVFAIGRKHLEVGCVADSEFDIENFARKYVTHLGISLKNLSCTEITFGSWMSQLRLANRRDYIGEIDDVLDKFDLGCLTSRHSLEFGENLCREDAGKEELIGVADKFFVKDTFLPELDRIYSAKKLIRAKGHPVHYVLETDNLTARREICRAVLNALRSNKRLESSRYSFLDFSPSTDFSFACYDTLYRTCIGGAVIVRYTAQDDAQDSQNASAEAGMIEFLCETAKRYKNTVLTIFCFPRECKRIKEDFYKELGEMSFIELREDFIDCEKAKDVLKSFAKECHVRCDKNLFAFLEEDRTYLLEELRPNFDLWYDKKLKNSVYPQYKEISVACSNAAKAAPKGSAYEELMEMIGLNDAKSVIKKALNYYKMQSLYEERGVKQNTPAMHMVFTGNPGTAKTTAARLFARIMRENGLLSKGHLVEVGRSDLVGRYVGWTAKIVQEKFKAARGGVLFIDEAYSLCDERAGSFGTEAINTIVQEMENRRSELVVIFAGYPDKMEEFLQSNPGLRSRIAFHVPFADYDSSELCQIAKLISKSGGMKFDKAALEKLERVFDTARTNSDFGNGRYVRNIFEQAKMNQASRLLEKKFDEITNDEITTITADDIIIPSVKKCEQKRAIGF